MAATGPRNRPRPGWPGIGAAARDLLARARPRPARSLAAGLLAVLTVLIALALLPAALPDPLFRDPFATAVLARDGRMLGAKIAPDGQWRFPPLDTCPRRFAVAAMAYEDRRFRRHPGVDPLALGRALVRNLRPGGVRSGASTLTMQVIRLSRRGRPRTVPEKAREALLALGLERVRSKEGILALYASHAPFGGNVVGLPAAAWRYFGRAPEDLSWGETALLAVLPNSPALLHPGRNREPLRRKRDRLLVRLWREGHMDSLACALARLEPLPEKPLPLPRHAPHLVERLAARPPGDDARTRGGGAAARNEAASPRGEAGRPGSPGPHRTSLDADLQARAAGILARRRDGLAGAGIEDGAILVLETATGLPLAYVGNMPATGGAPGREADMVAAARSTGSLLKPFLYAAMLDAGELLPGTLVADVPSPIGGYAPENFDRGFEGAVPARMALARSLNVPAVRMLRDFGIGRFLHQLRDLGLTTLTRSADDYGLTLVLGGAEGSLRELCGLYAGLARSALRPDPPPPPAPGPAAAWLVLQAMAEVSRPDAERHWRSFASSRWVAWKTGTSFGFRDAWAMGVTPEYVVGVWIGNASGQGRPGMTGIEAAAPVLFETFNLLPPSTAFPQPLGALVRIPLCRRSGMRPSPECPVLDSAWVPRAGLRTAACPYHRLVHLDSAGFRVHDGCAPVAAMRHVPWFVLPPSQEWFYRQRHSDYLPAPPWRPDCASGGLAGQPRSMELLYPRGPAKIYVPVDLDARRGRTVFEAVHRDPAARVYWHLDQEYLGTTREFHKLEADPAPGRHVLLLVDDKGERLEHAFEVLDPARRRGSPSRRNPGTAVPGNLY